MRLKFSLNNKNLKKQNITDVFFNAVVAFPVLCLYHDYTDTAQSELQKLMVLARLD